MANTLHVKATTTDRQVILSEYDEAHPGPTHEAWIAGYPDTLDDEGNTVEGNPAIEVGDTALVRQRIAEGLLVEVGAAAKARAGEADTPEARRQAEAQAAEARKR